MYSKHARERMILRGISVESVEKALKMGSKEIQRQYKILAHYRYFTVVYKIVDNVTLIITVKPK